MLIEILGGILLGALLVVTVAACIKLAKNYFEKEPDTTRVDFVKKDSEEFLRIMNKHPRFKAALNGETTGVVLQYKNGRLSKCASLEKNFGSEFDDCSGFRFRRRNPQMPIKIK